MKFSEFNPSKPPASKRPAPDKPAPSPPPPAKAPVTEKKTPALRRAGDPQKAYGQAIAAAKALLKDDGKREPARRCVEELLSILESGGPSLLVLAAKSTASNYFYAHSVNVSILSMSLGLSLGWDREELAILGLCAMLNDIGLAKSRDLDEYEEQRLHPVESRGLLEHIHGVEEAAKHAAADSKIRNLALAAQVIALCDLFEAMSHHRPWREPALPAQAVSSLIKWHSQEFPRGLLKVFLEKVSLYPPGSYVQLESGEIARVLGVHPKMPTRPLVEIRLRGDLTVYEPPLTVDLAANPLQHVRAAIDETRLAVKDKKVLMAFQAARWWVD